MAAEKAMTALHLLPLDNQRCPHPPFRVKNMRDELPLFLILPNGCPHLLPYVPLLYLHENVPLLRSSSHTIVGAFVKIERMPLT